MFVSRVRWQINRLLPDCGKTEARLINGEGEPPRRILYNDLCQNMIAMLIQHWLLVLGTWHDPYRSLVKAAKLVRQSALELLSAFDW